MKRIVLASFIALVLIASCKSSKDLGELTKQIEISIEQNGKTIKSINGVVTLNKEVFNIVVTFPRPMGILVNTSFEDHLYKLASEGKKLIELPEFQKPNIIAVALKNPDQLMFMTAGSSSPLFYENDEEHNFNSIEIENNSIQCIRNVKQFSHEDAPDDIAIHDIHDPIYMVFASTEMAVETPKDVKFKGKHLKIEWRE